MKRGVASEANGTVSLSPDINRINNFDLLRLFGAGQVALLHALGFLNPSALGPVEAILGFFPGVPIFFAISGFLVSLSLERATSIRQYFVNRALRIFPALWVCFLVSLVVVTAAGFGPPSLGQFLLWAGSQLTVAQYYNPDWLRGFGVGALNGSLWTIPVELEFYAVLPLLAVWARTNVKRWVTLAVLAAIIMLGFRALGPVEVSLTLKLVSVTVAPWLFYFLVGVLLRYADAAFPRIFRGNALRFGLAYVIWMGVQQYFGIPGATGNYLNVVSIVLLSALVISLAFTNHTLSSRVLGTTDISYGLYIYHMPFVNLFLEKGVVGPRGVVAALATAATLASLSWFFIERPALSLKHYTLKRRT